MANTGSGRSDPNKAREKKFVAHYSVHFNGAAAVRFAGFETAHPRQYATELLAKPRIQAAFQVAIAQLGELHFQLHNELVADLVRMKNADIASIYKADGTLKPMTEWPEEMKLMLRGFEIEERVTTEELAEGEEGNPIETVVRTKSVKLESHKAVRDSLAKITGQIIDRTQFVGKDGMPVDPVSAPAPIINVTVGQIAVDPATAPQSKAKKRKS